MVKVIKSKSIQSIPLNWVPYKNAWGLWVWHGPNTPAIKRWPGIKNPSWAKNPIVSGGKWAWTDGGHSIN
jgi:hypothetical protein